MNSRSIAGQLSNVSVIVDDQLLKACALGDRGAQYRLYGLCHSFMMGICIRYATSRDDAEDLLNRSFLKILTNIARYRQEVPFGLWVRRITVNTIIDEYRKTRKDKEHVELTDFSESPVDGVAINAYVEKMDAEQLQALIDTLPETSRSVFNLHVVDGYSHKEIASMLGISEGTSKWHVNNARTRLKALIAKHFPHIKNLAS